MKNLPIFILIILLEYVACQWIDPHDMNTNVKEQYMKPSTLKKSSSTSSINTGEINSDICFSNLKRIVGVLMNSAHIDKRDPAMYNGHIRFNIDPDDFDFLMTLGKSDLGLDKLRKLDTIFSESFKRSLINEYLDQIESFQLKLYSTVVNIYNLWLLGVVFLLYVVYQLFRNNFSFAYVFKYLVILVLICDFGFRYQYLLEEAEEHNASIAYSANCDLTKMSWGEWAKFWLSNRDCERKTVTPLDAFLYQIKNIIIVPLQAFGTGMGSFGHNMFTTLPWGLNFIMWPLMLIFVIIVFVFTMVICTGQPMEVNLFYAIKFKFGGNGREHNENVLNERMVDALMDQRLPRPMVQNITNAVPPGDNNGENQAAAVQVTDEEIKPICNKSPVKSRGKINKSNNSGKIETSSVQNQSSSNSNEKSNNEPENSEVNDIVEDKSQDNSTESKVGKQKLS